MSEYPSMPDRPTHHISDGHKEILDDMVHDMTADEIRHTGNHLHNTADKLEDHAKSKVTMDDFKKAMSQDSYNNNKNDENPPSTS